MITDQLKRRVHGDVREQFVDNWVKSIVPGDLADKLDEYESVRANVRGAHSNDTRNGIDDLQLVDIKCGQTSIKAVIDTGAQISVLREDLIGKDCGEVGPDAVTQSVTAEEEKGLSRYSSNVPPISAEDETYEIKEKLKFPKRKLKELSRMLVTKSQRKVKLKASNNIVLVPQYWSFKREYSPDKRGIGTVARKPSIIN
ncbi:hypothetical protein TNIN_144681 [Trichonephila inaurata madagascariensis]|uniref:Peptidase A2 domain-containing protein n=1 Tax=Trichonephila inaurata madagascariensis TaxID=2747483 RepID=A0A8X7CF08_9ARAC|nr:hypothetical protein TNIN_144681 [Trichonephila inaurata madagascariensis]